MNRLARTVFALDWKDDPFGNHTKAESAKDFPKEPPKEAPRVAAKTIQLDAVKPDSWESTGLWVPAGEECSIACEHWQAWKVRVGCHADQLWHLEKWKRDPEISHSIALMGPVTKFTHPWGGLLYFEPISDKRQQQQHHGLEQATVSHAVQAPLFVLGKDADAEWRLLQRPFAAPWGELQVSGESRCGFQCN
jgi:hypothetical protein